MALVPAGAEPLTRAGHGVLVEAGAGFGSVFTDDAYRAAGAAISESADAVWSQAEMIVKVKKPIAVEFPRIRPKQVLFTYFHFAASKELTEAIVASGAVAIAYETVKLPSGELPSG